MGQESKGLFDELFTQVPKSESLFDELFSSAVYATDPPRPSSDLIELMSSRFHSTAPNVFGTIPNLLATKSESSENVPGNLIELLSKGIDATDPPRPSANLIELMYGAFNSNAPSAFSALPPVPPSPPTKSSYSSVAKARENCEKTLRQLEEILPIGSGRVIPNPEDLTIGGARRLENVAVLFLDICKFSSLPSGDNSEQDHVFTILSVFMTEMIRVVRDHGGHFEKNTGDGLMAYFDGPAEDRTQLAVDAAVTMHCYNDQVISPLLRARGLPVVTFRVGIETGLVTFARIGVRSGEHDSLVAVGTTPNVACKLMTLIPDGGIVLGNYARSRLSNEWKNQTVAGATLPGYVLWGTETPYPSWVLTYRAPDTSSWAAASALGGGLSGLGGKGGPLGRIGGL